MFEKLIDLVVQLWNRISPAQIIKVYETGAVLRFGKYNRTAEPGLCWKWPVVEDVVEVNSVITTLRLPPQSLTTKDGYGVVIEAIVKYQVVNVQAYVTQIWDQHDVLADVTMGSIHRAVKEHSWQELLEQSPEQRVLQFVRNEVNRFGFKIHNITFTSLGRVRSLRLIQQVAKDIDN